MPNAWTRGGSKGRAAKPTSKKPASLRHPEMDPQRVKVADELNGAKRDVLQQPRGPSWLRAEVPPKAAGGADRCPV